MAKEFWIVIGVFAIGFGLWTVHWYLTKDKGTMTGFATLIYKTPEVGHGGRRSDNWSYKIQFRVGEYEFPLYVLRQEYETIQVGMTGLLTWQEGNMLDFVPDEEDAE